MLGDDIVHATGNTWKNMNKASVAEAVDRSHNFYSILYRVECRLELKTENSVFNIKMLIESSHKSIISKSEQL